MVRSRTTRQAAQAQRLSPKASRSVRDMGEGLRHTLARPSGGQPMDTAARAFLEPRFGHSFAHVRVHDDTEADRLAQSMAANAFTTGRDIYFRGGQYAPGSRDGLHLLAHEAAHTMQQAEGPVAGRPGPGGALVSDPADSFERAAEAIADRAVSDDAPPVAAAPAGLPAFAASTGEVSSTQPAIAPGAFVQRDLWDDLTGYLPSWLGGPDDMVPASELPPAPELEPAPPVFPIDPEQREAEGLPPYDLPQSELPNDYPPPLGPEDMPAVGPLSDAQYEEWLRGKSRGGGGESIHWREGGYRNTPLPRPTVGPPRSHVRPIGR